MRKMELKAACCITYSVLVKYIRNSANVILSWWHQALKNNQILQATLLC